MCLTIQVLMGCMYTSHFRGTRSLKAKYFYKFYSQESSTIGLDTARQITAPNRPPTPETVQRSETGQSQLIR